VKVSPSTEPTGDGLKTLCLVVNPTLVPRFYGILQAGFWVKGSAGESVGEVLCGQLGLSVEYVNERISTVFLDGKPVDDIDSAIVREGSTLALSSAMPGLVGATMRRKGFYASFRNAITHREEGERSPEKEGLFRVKLFNLLMAELGPLFLERGIYLKSGEVEEFLANQAEVFFDACKDIVFEGRSLAPSLLRKTGWSAGSQWTQVRVCTSG
jgi:hypothetical protein